MWCWYFFWTYISKDLISASSARSFNVRTYSNQLTYHSKNTGKGQTYKVLNITVKENICNYLLFSYWPRMPLKTSFLTHPLKSSCQLCNFKEEICVIHLRCCPELSLKTLGNTLKNMRLGTKILIHRLCCRFVSQVNTYILVVNISLLLTFPSKPLSFKLKIEN